MCCLCLFCALLLSAQVFVLYFLFLLYCNFYNSSPFPPRLCSFFSHVSPNLRFFHSRQFFLLLFPLCFTSSLPAIFFTCYFRLVVILLPFVSQTVFIQFSLSLSLPLSSVCLSVCLYLCLSACRCLCLSLFLFVCQRASLPVTVGLHVCFSISISLFMCLPLCAISVFTFLTVYLCLPVCVPLCLLSVFPSLSLPFIPLFPYPRPYIL